MGIFGNLFCDAETLKNNKRDAFAKKLSELPRYSIVLGDDQFKRNYVKSMHELKFNDLSLFTPVWKLKTFIAFDTETTGIKVTGNYIIEVSAVKFVNYEPVQVFETLIKPPISIPAAATKINHITNGMVENAPSFAQIIPAMEHFFDRFPIVAHNTYFDVRHLYANGLTSIQNHTMYDTLGLSKQALPQLQNHKLATVCEHFGIYFDGAHRASADALACGMLFAELIAQSKGAKNAKALKHMIL